jgi:hypothetical protein
VHQCAAMRHALDCIAWRHRPGTIQSLSLLGSTGKHVEKDES